jgi:hypothetical protein
MAAAADVQVSQIRNYRFFPEDRSLGDFFRLEEGAQRGLLERINAQYREIEANYPAAGYKVRFAGSNIKDKSIEISLNAIGRREGGRPMKMPDQADCSFCSQQEEMPLLKELPESGARIIEGEQRNVVVISKRHSPHFLENSVDEQLAMIEAVKKVVAWLFVQGAYNYEVLFCCGKEADQSVSHTHAHILLGTNMAFSLLDETSLRREVVLVRA